MASKLHALSRTELLIGRAALDVLARSKVAVYGIGGVGTFAVEGLVRAGVRRFVLVDDDKVCLTNLNRQLHATTKTIGQYKVDAMKARILEIAPDAEVEAVRRFYLPEVGAELVPPDCDYLVDCVDTVAAKVDLAVRAQALGIPIVSAMGAGNKLDPTRFEVADVYATEMCPLARVMRKELKLRGVARLKVVYSKEKPAESATPEEAGCATGCVCPPGVDRRCTSRRRVPGSISFVPSVAGMILAGEVVKDLIAQGGKPHGGR